LFRNLRNSERFEAISREHRAEHVWFGLQGVLAWSLQAQAVAWACGARVQARSLMPKTGCGCRAGSMPGASVAVELRGWRRGVAVREACTCAEREGSEFVSQERACGCAEREAWV